MAYKIVTKVATIVETVSEQEVTLMGYIGAKIKMYREKAGLKQIELSRKTIDKDGTCLISAGTISTIEGGMGNSGVKLLEAIADALGIHISDLFPEKEEVIANELNTVQNERGTN